MPKDKPFSRVCVCDICGTEALTDRTELPNEWLITWNETATLCDVCLARWVERWGNEPDYWLKGDSIYDW